MNKTYTRRKVLGIAAHGLAFGAFGARFYISANTAAGQSKSKGAIFGEEVGAAVGRQILVDGGNAVDAAVAAALTSCVATPFRCGIGGYGGHMTLSLRGGKKITSIDFNGPAPAAARPDMYPLDNKGKVIDRINLHGWLAVGVPGTLAGLQLVLNKYGTRPFRELVQPAIELARKGFIINEKAAAGIRTAAPRFLKDPASAQLYLNGNEPKKAGEVLLNPELAELLATLAKNNSMDAFYNGDIAQRIAESSRIRGGLLTAKDLVGYKAREVEPLSFDLGEFKIFTAPLTAGGFTIVEAFSLLRVLQLPNSTSDEMQAHARLEALRLCWKDRLELLGDPEKVKVPINRLLSMAHAEEQADKIKSAVRDRKPVPIQSSRRLDEGTNNISAADADGNLIAITLTQGDSFGAQVTADGLGVTLGHGMSRFDPHPDHPNAPGPGKRPLHNMCPTIVLHRGQASLALGGAGGVRIPNAIFDVLTNYVIRRMDLAASMRAPRLNTSGTLDVLLESSWPKEGVDYLKDIGFKVQIGPAAQVSAVEFDSSTGECRGSIR